MGLLITNSFLSFQDFLLSYNECTGWFVLFKQSGTASVVTVLGCSKVAQVKCVQLRYISMPHIFPCKKATLSYCTLVCHHLVADQDAHTISELLTAPLKDPNISVNIHWFFFFFTNFPHYIHKSFHFTINQVVNL